MKKRLHIIKLNHSKYVLLPMKSPYKQEDKVNMNRQIHPEVKKSLLLY